MAKIYGNTTTTPLNPDMFGGSGTSVDLSSKMDKFGELFYESSDCYIHLSNPTQIASNGYVTTGIGCKLYIDDNLSGVVYMHTDGEHLIGVDENGAFVDGCDLRLTNEITADSPNDIAVPKKYVDEQIGDIETALDNIIAIQNELIGGGSV